MLLFTHVLAFIKLCQQFLVDSYELAYTVHIGIIQWLLQHLKCRGNESYAECVGRTVYETLQKRDRKIHMISAIIVNSQRQSW